MCLFGVIHSIGIVGIPVDEPSVVCDAIRAKVTSGTLTPAGASDEDQLKSLCEGRQLIIAAGAAGVCFLSEGTLQSMSDLKVAIDLNAVPPVGIADIAAPEKASEKSGIVCYGALGVGGTKMKVHKRAVAELFERNDAVLDTAEVYQIALEVAGLT